MEELQALTKANLGIDYSKLTFHVESLATSHDLIKRKERT